MKRNEVLKRIREIRLMPLFYHADPGVSIKVMEAVFEGGLPLMEFTNRGSNAFPVFEQMKAFQSDRYPDALLGIGSIIDAGTCEKYIQAGADFVVSPLLKQEVIETCHAREVLSMPGCSTLTEINQAETWGAEIVKVFPAAQLGGPAYIKAIRGPCPWLSIVVTGGVKASKENIQAWHEAGVTGFGIGSDLISKDLVQSGDFGALRRNVADLVAIVQSL